MRYGLCEFHDSNYESCSCQVGATVVGMGFLLEKARTPASCMERCNIEFNFLLEATKQLIFNEIPENDQVYQSVMPMTLS